jgi:hypothetical protein
VSRDTHWRVSAEFPSNGQILVAKLRWHQRWGFHSTGIRIMPDAEKGDQPGSRHLSPDELRRRARHHREVAGQLLDGRLIGC